MIKKLHLLCLILLIFAGVTACDKKDDSKIINLSNTVDAALSNDQSINESVRIAVGGMITPKEGFSYYRKLLDYIGDNIDKDVAFIDREDYSEINKMLKSNDIDVAFVCGGPYVDGHDDFGMELLVAPLAYGGTVYYSYIIAHKDSVIDDFNGLKGKTFAFSDPMSNTGSLVPTYMLAQIGETPETYFKNYDFTYAHDKSIKAVATGLVDGAAVDSLIWEYANKINPEFTSKTRIIKKSSPYGIPPVVVRPGMDPKLKSKIKNLLVNLHKDEAGREILKGMLIDKFVEIDDSAYNSIREMKIWIAQNT